jgi:hypothetical protein
MSFALGATIIVALAALAAWAYERGTREHYELEAQRSRNAADRWRRAYNSAADRARQACGEDA